MSAQLGLGQSEAVRRVQREGLGRGGIKRARRPGGGGGGGSTLHSTVHPTSDVATSLWPTPPPLLPLALALALELALASAFTMAAREVQRSPAMSEGRRVTVDDRIIGGDSRPATREKRAGRTNGANATPLRPRLPRSLSTSPRLSPRVSATESAAREAGGGGSWRRWDGMGCYGLRRFQCGTSSSPNCLRRARATNPQVSEPIKTTEQTTP